MKVLSSRQQRIINFIRRFGLDRGYPPTIRDIVDGCDISSTSVVDYNLNILEREGFIRRHHEVSRGIELLDWSSSASEHHLQIPVIGQIAAGEPIPVPAPDTWNITASSETLEVTAFVEDVLVHETKLGSAADPYQLNPGVTFSGVLIAYTVGAGTVLVEVQDNNGAAIATLSGNPAGATGTEATYMGAVAGASVLIDSTAAGNCNGYLVYTQEVP